MKFYKNNVVMLHLEYHFQVSSALFCNLILNFKFVLIIHLIYLAKCGKGGSFINNSGLTKVNKKLLTL